tara:strand:+ start:18528 stop:18773 length:246 start_codon:yes stop_codon:yes gene_type:complete
MFLGLIFLVLISYIPCNTCNTESFNNNPKDYEKTLEKMVSLSNYFKRTNISNDDKNTFIENAIIQNMSNKEIEKRRLKTYQ